MKVEKAFKFEVTRQLAPPPPISKDELFILRWWLAWLRRRSDYWDFMSFRDATRYYKDATKQDFCEALDDIIKQQTEAVKKGFEYSASKGMSELSRLERYLKFKDFCETIHLLK